MIVSTTEIFRHAYGRYAVGAYNFNNLEQLLGLFRGNLGKTRENDEPVIPEKAAPFIVQLIPGALEYSDPQFIQGMLQAAEEIFPDAIYSIHLDHGTEEDCYACIASGIYRSVMVDASYSPLEENIAVTRRVVERAHEKGITVEAELGEIGGQETEREGKVLLTHPDQAAEFVERTGCDSLAVAIGTSHGAFKFTGASVLHWERLQEIQRALPPRFPLVLHGASAVPQEWIARINAAGGAMRNAKGCNEEEYFLAARYGVCKINIDTDGRLVWYGTHREFFRDCPQEFDLRGPGKNFMEQYARSIQHKSAMLGSAGEWKSFREELLQTASI
ncbi:MAG: class II fructose-bisphosphate aldolase family protein [Planctomycetia bacterium]|nr:class II fructose-bisphosphate aldolase family protein [Planctomycetia bacterium]